MQWLRTLTMLTLVVSAVALWVTPSAVRAHDHAHDHSAPSFAPQCHAATGPDVTIEEMVLADTWNCENKGWRADEPTAWLLFDAQSWDGEYLPRFFFTRIARFETMAFAAVDYDGSMRTGRYVEADGDPFASGPVFQLALPEVTAETRIILVRIDKPHSIPLLTEARLTHNSEDADWSQLEMMLLALVVGMLILPLFFDISFFVVLRERFVAIHAVMVASMITYVMFAGGLISLVAELPVALIAIVAPLCWALGCGLSALFLADFLEEGAQSPFMRRLTVFAGLWTITVPGFFALQMHATQPVDDRMYFLTFFPAIAIITGAIVEAVLRGSRSARYIAVAWAPIILVSVERMLRGLGVYVGPSQLDQMIYIATAFEVIVISLAIADRFLALRNERDAAVTEARMLERLSERDPLTGLMNRRAIEPRFRDLRKQGFDTFALVDLDKFKDINDRYGHQIGDRALIACANAISANDDRDTIAVRLGGEEFVVLLRGRRAVDRAEAHRQAIAVRIASEVPGLDRPVTASMGVIELPRSSKEMMSFEEMYARADQLLYEAKASGRNRMYFERLKVFDKAPLSRSEGQAAA